MLDPSATSPPLTEKFDSSGELAPNAHEVQQAPWPGSHEMPRWDLGELIEPPRFDRSRWFAMIGPGLLMGGAAIGGGEWLVGPMVTARYGGALLWLGTLSILGQVIYNLEISRYTLYTGEPIFTGKFRLIPGPLFWVGLYLLLDFGSVLPYLAANAATPLATLMLGHVPDPAIAGEKSLLRMLAYAIFLAALIPMVVGGRIYLALKRLMTFKVVVVLGFLLLLGLFASRPATWSNVFSGFVQFGNLPVERGEDRNGNGTLDPGEDWDNDGRLDVIEPWLTFVVDTDGDLKRDATDIDRDGIPDPMVPVTLPGGQNSFWPDLDRDGRPDAAVMLDTDGDGVPDRSAPLDADGDGRLDRFIDLNGDGFRDGDNVENILAAAVQGRPLPKINWTVVGFLSALVAICGSGGLSNTPISNYTRDQGWGMGHHVGAIPSVIGGRNIQLSHVGCVFAVTAESLRRWRGWFRHVLRDQLVIWMPACFLGLALPCMMSVEFLHRGTSVDNDWVAAALTAGNVQERIGGALGDFCWFMTLFCGFLVLGPSMAVTADGYIRRWVDVFWTSSKTLRRLNPGAIRYVYFAVLSAYAVFGLVMLSLQPPTGLLLISTLIFNFAFGVSCWHTLFVNVVLLPRELRPNWFMRLGLLLTGAFFLLIAVVSTLERLCYL